MISQAYNVYLVSANQVFLMSNASLAVSLLTVAHVFIYRKLLVLAIVPEKDKKIALEMTDSLLDR